ncbi:MAG: restriction endonuclease subunit S [Myxococcaceae bacterium]|nr:restriction endonuclease subunit S [Myxococcaceae bacterium]
MIKLSEIAYYASDKTNIVDIKQENYISTENMFPNRGGIFECESLPETTKVTQYAPGDILVSNIRPYFKKIWFSNRVGGCSNDVLVFKTKVLNNRFLYYVLSQDSFFDHMMAGANGTKMPRGNKKEILDFLVPNFDIQKQNRIASILSAYDDLIETNQKQIKLLEEAAQRLYKEWFVDLKFPGHEKTKIIDGVPEGWVQCRLENVIHFNPKVTLSKERMKQSIPMSALSTTSMVLNADDFTTTLSNSGSKFQNGDTLLARITPCLENGKTAFVSGIESDEGAVGSTEFIIMRSNGISPYMVYLLARTEDFRQESINSMIGSDGRQRAQVDKIKVLPYLKPSATIIKAFEKCVAPLFAQIQTKNKQYAELKQARDRLLPKLMSREIEV